MSVRSTFELGGVGNEEKELKVLRATVIDRKIQNHDLFPDGWNWRFVECLILITCIMYVAYVILVWQILDYTQFPYRMPFDKMISGLFISNAGYVPVALYSMVGDLRRVAAICTIPTRLYIISYRSILKVYQKHIINLLIVVSLVTILFWLPYVFMDMTLFALFDITADEAEQVNLVSIYMYIYMYMYNKIDKMLLNSIANIYTFIDHWHCSCCDFDSYIQKII